MTLRHCRSKKEVKKGPNILNTGILCSIPCSKRFQDDTTRKTKEAKWDRGHHDHAMVSRHLMVA